jgi:hypothetical protein
MPKLYVEERGVCSKYYVAYYLSCGRNYIKSCGGGERQFDTMADVEAYAERNGYELAQPAASPC